MSKRIATIQLDGGTGKTAISYAIAKDLNFFLISNDDSIIEQAYPNMAKIMKNPKVIDDVVYDFGGFVDSGVLDVIKSCNIVIVPCMDDLNSKMKAIKTIKQITNYCSNILVIATRLKNPKKDFKEVADAIHKVYPSINVYPLRETKILKNSIEFGQSPLELEAESKLIATNQKNVLNEYKEILKVIKGAIDA
jgi:MinD-like ATPase involved in chromosome partitioning or flagellar assembly